MVAAGETGFVIASDDVEALAREIGRLVEQPQLRTAMGLAGQQRALRRFTIDRTIAEFNTLLWQVYTEAKARA